MKYVERRRYSNLVILCSRYGPWRENPLLVCSLVATLMMKRERSDTVVVGWAMLTLLHLCRARPACEVSVPTDLHRGRLLNRVEVIEWI